MITNTLIAPQTTLSKRRLAFNHLEKRLAHLSIMGKKSSSLIPCQGLQFESQGVSWHIPKYMFLGARGSGAPIKVGIFSGFNAEGLDLAIAVSKFTATLEKNSAGTKDYALFIYPIVNPRSSRKKSAFDDFWSQPDATEVQFLEQEIRKTAFDGVIQIVADKNSVTTAVTSSALLGSEVLKPALQAIQHLLPVRSEPVITSAAFDGKRPNRTKSFDIILNIPGDTSYEVLIPAIDIFFREILQNYRSVISHAQNI